jgi:hypothetical protein
VGYVSVSYKTVSHQMCLSSPTTNGAFRHNLGKPISSIRCLSGRIYDKE